MDALAVIFEKPQSLRLGRLAITEPKADEVVVDVEFSGISTGTERLLWQGLMPPFPGMGYPLVPGYETVGRVIASGTQSDLEEGAAVFVPGANCFDGARGLFGGAASRLVVPEKRVVPIADEAMSATSVLLALAATAHHALKAGPLPELIIGHGVLGRLMARLVPLLGGADPTVWELNPQRRQGSTGYQVIDPEVDERLDYAAIADVSGDHEIIDRAVQRLARGGEILLAGFYHERLSFAFPQAFMKEARLRVAAEWQPLDMAAVQSFLTSGDLSLDGLVTHTQEASKAEAAYVQAFDDPSVLKMILDWRGLA